MRHSCSEREEVASQTQRDPGGSGRELSERDRSWYTEAVTRGHRSPRIDKRDYGPAGES